MEITYRLNIKFHMTRLLIFLSMAFLAFPNCGFCQSSLQIYENLEGPSDCRQFTVESKKAFRPDIQNFRLEQIEPKQYFVPILFGSDKVGFVVDDDRRVHRLTLQLSSHLFVGKRQEKPQREMQRQRQPLPGLEDKPVWDLYGGSYFEAGAKYRLTWTSKRQKLNEGQSKHSSLKVEFQVPKSEDSQNTSESGTPKFYLVETVFEHFQQPDSLFLGQEIVNDAPLQFQQSGGTAISFKDSKSLTPPQRVMQRLDKSVKASYDREMKQIDFKQLIEKPDLAEFCGYAVRADADQPNSFTIGYSCERWSMARPVDDENEFALWQNDLYRVELLDRNVERQRKDESHWKSRLKLILDEAELIRGDETQRINRTQDPDKINAWASAMKAKHKIKE